MGLVGWNRPYVISNTISVVFFVFLQFFTPQFLSAKTHHLLPLERFNE